MVCITSSTGNIMERSHLKLAIRMPSGAPITIDSSTATSIKDSVCMAESHRPSTPSKLIKTPMPTLNQGRRLASHAKAMVARITAHQGDWRSNCSIQTNRFNSGWVKARSVSAYSATKRATNWSTGWRKDRGAMISGNMRRP